MNQRVNLTETERAIIDEIVTRFVNDHKPSYRHSLILKFEDPDALTDLANRGFLKNDPTNQNFLPTLLAFCCCGNESVLSEARDSTVSVIKAMRSLFSKVEPNALVTASDIGEEIKSLGASLTDNTLWLGLYLAESFSVFGGWQPASDQIGKDSVRIGERVVKMKNPEQLWNERVSQEYQWLRQRDSYTAAARTIQRIDPFHEDSDTEISFTHATSEPFEAPGANPMEKGLQIFISHSSHDKELAKQLIDLLRVALPIDPQKIRCTSVDGYRLEGGTDANEQIRTEIWGARVFIGLLTPTSLASTYVLFELGARWGAKLQLKPLVAAGMQAGELKAPLSSLNALSCDNEAQVLQLIREIGKILDLTLHHADSYLSNVRALVNYSLRMRAPFDAATASGPESALAAQSAAKPPVSLVVTAQFIRFPQPSLAEFQITAKLLNSGQDVLKSYHVDVEIPARLLENDSASHWHELPEKRTPEIRVFRFPHRDSLPLPIYPDDLKPIATVTSYLTSVQVHDPELRKLNYVATLYANSRKITVSKPLAEIFQLAKADELLPL